MVDTAAGATLIRQSVYQGLGAPKLCKVNDILRGVTGHTLKMLGETTLQFEASPECILTHRTVVVPDNYIDTDVLLGWDLLRRLRRVSIEEDNKEVVWGKYRFPYYLLPTIPDLKGVQRIRVNVINKEREENNGKEKESESIRIHATVPFSIPARRSCIQELKIAAAAGKSVILTLTHPHLKLPFPIYSKVDENGFMNLLCINETKSRVKIKRGKVLGKFSIINEEFVEEEIVENAEQETEVVPPPLHHVCTTHHPLLSATHNKIGNCLSINCIQKEVNTISNVELSKPPKISNAMLPEINDLGSNFTRKEKFKKLVSAQDFSHLDRSQRKKLKQILEHHEKLFIVERDDIGTLKVPPQHLYLEDSTPIRGPQYRHPEKARAIIKEMLEEMKEKDIIEDSTAAWLSPIVLVSKPDGSKRLCLDYRGVNKKLKMDIHPLPRLDELVEQTSGQAYYCTLDLKDAYYQLVLDEESRDITTFSDGFNLWRFKRLPFGLTVSPAIFTRAINQVIAPLAEQGFVRNYLDDVIVYASSYEELLEHLSKVFHRFEIMGVKLNIAKCKFAHRSVKFLGHIVSEKGVEPDPENVEGILQVPPPKNLKEVRRFLGMTGFYRKAIEKYAAIASPLTHLTRKDVDFEWSEKCQEAFEELKLKLATAPVLCKVDFNLEFELHTDASGVAAGAALHQRHPDGTLRPLGFFSKKFRPVEMRYSTTDREALGIVLACRFFHHFLWGSKVTIKTDHRSLVSVFKRKTKSPRMTRWSLEMREYDFKIEYQEGRANVVADQLSRYVRVVRIEPQSKELEKQVEKLKASFAEIAVQQDQEERWKSLKLFLNGGEIPKYKYAKTMVSQFEVVDGVLFYVRTMTDGTMKYCLVVPKGMKRAALHASHDGQTAGHLGQFKTITRCEAEFYWPGYRQDCISYVKSCPLCLQYKETTGLQQKWQGLSEIKKPLERVSVDLTDMHAGIYGYRYVLTVIDHYSRFVNFYKLKTKSAQEVSRQFSDFIKNYGPPKSVIADNGTEFTATVFKELCENYGIKLNFTIPYHPQGNSITERMHRSFKTCLAIMTEGYPNRWPEYLKDAQYALNTAVHTAIGVQPYYAFFSRHVARSFSTTWPLVENDSEEGILKAHELIRKTNAKMSEKFRNQANQKRKDEIVKINDLVYVRIEKTIPGTSVKLNPKWHGPFTVVKVLRNGSAYELQNPFEEDVVIRRAAEKVKRFVDRQELIDKFDTFYGTENDEGQMNLETEMDVDMDFSKNDNGANSVPEAVSLPREDTLVKESTAGISPQGLDKENEPNSIQLDKSTVVDSGRRYPARQRKQVDRLTYE